MPVIVVPLKDVVTDETNPVDLSALPVEEAVERIKKIYDFFADSVKVEISNGIATITLPETEASRINQALHTFERASAAAARGRYQQAIPLFQEVVRALPEHTKARRELAMALMESGSAAAAKKHLIRVLQLDPGDAWALLILGNIYFHHDKDLGSAERYYQAAYDLDSEDPYILTAFAGLKAHRGDYTGAKPLFERALSTGRGQYTNPYVGLAMVQDLQGDTDTALETLEHLFALGLEDNPRSAPVMEQARKEYARLRAKRAAAHRDETMDRLRAEFDVYTEESGIPIRIEPATHLDTDAKLEAAWRYGRDEHLLLIRGGALSPYLAAHEFEHVLLEQEARRAGVNRLFTTHQGHVQTALRVIEKDMRRLRSRSELRQAGLDEYIAQIIGGLANQLFNAPLDLFIDARIHANRPYMHDDQFTWLVAQHERNLKAVTDKSVRDLAPTKIYQANVAMNAATALYMDELYGGRTDFARQYQSSGQLPTARHLLGLYREATAGPHPGVEYELVDAWAETLKLTGWYGWLADTAPDPADRPPGDRDPGPEGGPSNPELLTDPNMQMAATMYLLGALRRYTALDDSQVRQIASEIALLGATGLDYASSDKKYTLRSVPGESFSGLQLMCLMYAGFKRLHPEHDLGMPFADAYRQAMAMYDIGM